MTEVEYDKIIDIGTQGNFIKLKVTYHQSRFSLTGYTGLLYMDRKSAHGLGIIPREDIGEEELKAWYNANKDRLEFKIVSNIKAEVVEEIREIYKKYEKLLEKPLSGLGVSHDLPEYMNKSLESLIRQYNEISKIGRDEYRLSGLNSFFGLAWFPLHTSASRLDYFVTHNMMKEYEKLYNEAIEIYEKFFKEVTTQLGFPYLEMHKIKIGDEFNSAITTLVGIKEIPGYGRDRIVDIVSPLIIDKKEVRM